MFLVISISIYYKIINYILKNEKKLNYKNFISSIFLIISLPFIYTIIISNFKNIGSIIIIFILLFFYIFYLIVYNTNIIGEFFQNIYNFFFFKKIKKEIEFNWSIFDQLIVKKTETKS